MMRKEKRKLDENDAQATSPSKVARETKYEAKYRPNHVLMHDSQQANTEQHAHDDVLMYEIITYKCLHTLDSFTTFSFTAKWTLF